MSLRHVLTVTPFALSRSLSKGLQNPQQSSVCFMVSVLYALLPSVQYFGYLNSWKCLETFYTLDLSESLLWKLSPHDAIFLKPLCPQSLTYPRVKSDVGRCQKIISGPQIFISAPFEFPDRFLPHIPSLLFPVDLAFSVQFVVFSLESEPTNSTYWRWASDWRENLQDI